MKRLCIPVKLVILLLSVALVVTAVGCAGGKESAQSPTAQEKKLATTENPDLAFYNGKIVRLVVPANPGEQFDRWARIIAPALQKQLPGSTVIVENVGGGGRKPGTNRVYKAEPDGLTIGLLYRASLISQLVGEEGVDYDFTKFTWLGNLSEEPRYLVVAAKSPYHSVADIAKAKDFKFGCTGVGSFDWYDTRLLAHIFGWKNARTVPGYASSQDVLAAMLKGEVDGYMSIGDQARSLDLNDYRIILEEAAPEGRAPAHPFGKIEKLADVAPKEAQPYVNFIYSLYYLAKPMCAPPGLPEGKTKVLRSALENVAKDPEFLEAAKKNGFNVVFTDGETLSKIINDYVTKTPQEVIDFLKAASKAK